MKRSDAVRASNEGTVRLGASLVERLYALGFKSGSDLNELLANSWAGRGTYIGQAERALRTLRRRTLSEAQRAIVDELARAIDGAREHFIARTSSGARPVAGTLRLSALLSSFGSAQRPAATRLSALWREGAAAPRALVEEALREIEGVPVSEWGAGDKRELVRELSDRIGPRAVDLRDPRVVRLVQAFGPPMYEISTPDAAKALGITRASAWQVMRALERADALIGDPRDRNGEWVERDPVTLRTVVPGDVFWSVPQGTHASDVARQIVALAESLPVKPRRSR